jgi:hypothetical protein
MRSGAARREVRQAKKAVARAESGKKKGKRVAGAGKGAVSGPSKKINKRGAGRGPPVAAAAAAAAAKSSKKLAEEPESEDEEEGMEARFTAAEKKVRLATLFRHARVAAIRSLDPEIE